MKKGFDFVNNNGKFTDEACIDLGVGRNMVNSIRFWLKAFNVIDLENEKNTEIADFIFNEESGKDKYLENETTLWLLHYLLVSQEYSSIYSIIFNHFRKIKPEFDKDNFVSYMLSENSKINKNTLGKDFSIFLRTYYSKDIKNIEDSFYGLLSDLSLVHEIKKDTSLKFYIQNATENSIPLDLVLFVILENQNYGQSISFKQLFNDFNSVGNIFAFTQEQLEKKLIQISEKYSSILYTNDAGVKELQFKGNKPNSLKILEKCYE
ncbi:DUF4007 family protein [Kordia sp.]|uniref:DUF4007 family protein n=1 Tax=Kordia sp. TaxID=1965332 RepID=UPI003D2CEAAE